MTVKIMLRYGPLLHVSYKSITASPHCNESSAPGRYCYSRLKLLEQKYTMYMMLNQGLEDWKTRHDPRDFFNIHKVRIQCILHMLYLLYMQYILHMLYMLHMQYFFINHKRYIQYIMHMLYVLHTSCCTAVCG
jgi:hypothetical protein